MYRLLTLTIASLTAWSAVSAATLTATPDNYKLVFARALAGDTVRFQGHFNRVALADRSFSRTLTLDLSGANFSNTFSLSAVKNVRVVGARLGSTHDSMPTGLTISNSSNVSVQRPVVVGNGGSSIGLLVRGSDHVVIDGGTFTGLKLGVGFISVSHSQLTNNQSLRSSNDGFNVADSHDILVSHNSCSGTAITPLAHPDCVQLWSIAGRKPISDIEISDNVAVGATQGFTIFSGLAGGADRIKFLRNRVDTSFPQGIACYNCRNSVVFDNVLTTQAGARWRTNINIVGGYGNKVQGNSVGLRLPAVLATYSLGVLPAAFLPESTSLFDQRKTSEKRILSHFVTPASPLALRAPKPLNAQLLPTSAAVPEPSLWMLFIGGFGLIGGAVRKHRHAGEISGGTQLKGSAPVRTRRTALSDGSGKQSYCTLSILTYYAWIGLVLCRDLLLVSIAETALAGDATKRQRSTGRQPSAPNWPARARL